VRYEDEDEDGWAALEDERCDSCSCLLKKKKKKKKKKRCGKVMGRGSTGT